MQQFLQSLTEGSGCRYLQSSKKNANYPSTKVLGFNVRIFKLQKAFISALKCGAFGLFEVKKTRAILGHLSNQRFESLQAKLEESPRY